MVQLISILVLWISNELSYNRKELDVIGEDFCFRRYQTRWVNQGWPHIFPLVVFKSDLSAAGGWGDSTRSGSRGMKGKGTEVLASTAD